LESEHLALVGTDAGAENSFDVEKYVRRSRKVDISDLDLSRTADYPLTADEIRCLTYMMDIEGHTIVYLKSILNTCAIRDPQTTAFLSCWLMKNFFTVTRCGSFSRPREWRFLRTGLSRCKSRRRGGCGWSRWWRR
jgi:hypothetical protein